MDIEKTIKEALKEAAKIGAEAALKAAEKEREAAQKVRHDRRLQNTELLLEKYRVMKANCMESVSSAAEAARNAENIDIECLMWHLDEKDFRVESTYRTAGRTYILVQHIDKMLKIYACLCERSEREDYKRHYRNIMAIYIEGDVPAKVEDLAVKEKIDSRTVYKDIKAAIETLSTLFFGVDVLQF